METQTGVLAQPFINENTEGEKNSATGKIVVAVILLLLALSVGTYAFIDMSQHKLDRAVGEGQSYQVTLNNIFDPATAVNWKVTGDIDGDANPLEPGELPKEISATTHEDSAPTYIRVRLMEFMGFGDDYPYTQVRFVTDPATGNFLNVSLNELKEGEDNVNTLVGAFTDVYGLTATDIAELIGHEPTAADFYEFRTKLNQDITGEVDADTTVIPAVFLKSGRNQSDSNGYDARNGQLGAYLQYKSFVSDIETPSLETPGITPISNAIQGERYNRDAELSEPSSSLITGAHLAQIDQTDVTVDSAEKPGTNGTLDDPDTDGSDVPFEDDLGSIGSAADEYMLTDRLYKPVDPSGFTNRATNGKIELSTLSSDFRQYVKLNFGDDVALLSSLVAPGGAWEDAVTPISKWVIDDLSPDVDEIPGGDGWVYWGQALPAGQTTPDLLKSIQLIKQPSDSFQYSQYVSMNAWGEDDIPSDIDIPASILTAWGDTPVACPPEITTDKEEYVLGEKITVTGKCFQFGEEVTIAFHSDPIILDNLRVPNEDGSFTWTGFVPKVDKDGIRITEPNHTIHANGNVSEVEAIVNVLITDAYAVCDPLQTNPEIYGVEIDGQYLRIHGCGFGDYTKEQLLSDRNAFVSWGYTADDGTPASQYGTLDDGADQYAWTNTVLTAYVDLGKDTMRNFVLGFAFEFEAGSPKYLRDVVNPEDAIYESGSGGKDQLVGYTYTFTVYTPDRKVSNSVKKDLYIDSRDEGVDTDDSCEPAPPKPPKALIKSVTSVDIVESKGQHTLNINGAAFGQNDTNTVPENSRVVFRMKDGSRREAVLGVNDFEWPPFDGGGDFNPDFASSYKWEDGHISIDIHEVVALNLVSIMISAGLDEAIEVPEFGAYIPVPYGVSGPSCPATITKAIVTKIEDINTLIVDGTGFGDGSPKNAGISVYNWDSESEDDQWYPAPMKNVDWSDTRIVLPFGTDEGLAELIDMGLARKQRSLEPCGVEEDESTFACYQLRFTVNNGSEISNPYDVYTLIDDTMVQIYEHYSNGIIGKNLFDIEIDQNVFKLGVTNFDWDSAVESTDLTNESWDFEIMPDGSDTFTSVKDDIIAADVKFVMGSNGKEILQGIFWDSDIFTLGEGVTVRFTNTWGKPSEFYIFKDTRIVLSSIEALESEEIPGGQSCADGKSAYKLEGTNLGDTPILYEYNTELVGIDINRSYPVAVSDIIQWAAEGVVFCTDQDLTKVGTAVTILHWYTNTRGEKEYSTSNAVYINDAPYVSSVKNEGNKLQIRILGDITKLDEMYIETSYNTTNPVTGYLSQIMDALNVSDSGVTGSQSSANDELNITIDLNMEEWRDIFASETQMSIYLSATGGAAIYDDGDVYSPEYRVTYSLPYIINATFNNDDKVNYPNGYIIIEGNNFIDTYTIDPEHTCSTGWVSSTGIVEVKIPGETPINSENVAVGTFGDCGNVKVMIKTNPFNDEIFDGGDELMLKGSGNPFWSEPFAVVQGKVEDPEVDPDKSK